MRYDVEGNVLLWNPQAERLFGWRADEVIAKPLPIVPVDRMRQYQRMRDELLAGRRVAPFETERLGKDGSLFDVVLSARLLRCQFSDDGVGFPSSAERSGGLGLTSMRERAAALGGTLQPSRSNSGGALVRVDLPFDSDRAEERASMSIHRSSPTAGRRAGDARGRLTALPCESCWKTTEHLTQNPPDSAAPSPAPIHQHGDGAERGPGR